MLVNIVNRFGTSPKKKLATIGQIAEILGVDTEVTVVSLDLRREGSRLGQNEAV